MTRAETASRGVAWRVVAAALLPFAAQSIYILFTRWTFCFNPWSDVASHAISLLIGAWCVWSLPIALSRRVLALLLYVPIIAFLLYYYTFAILMVVFGIAL